MESPGRASGERFGLTGGGGETVSPWKPVAERLAGFGVSGCALRVDAELA